MSVARGVASGAWPAAAAWLMGLSACALAAGSALDWAPIARPPLEEVSEVVYADGERVWATRRGDVPELVRGQISSGEWRAARVVEGGPLGALAELPPVFLDASRGWLAAGARTWRTTDGGQRWSVALDAAAAAMAFSGAGHGVAAIPVDGGWRPMLTEDGGAGWRPCAVVPAELGAPELLALHAREAWAVVARAGERVGERAMLRSDDGGCTWAPLWRAVPGAWFDELRFIDATHGWMVQVYGVTTLYTTSDGGQRWAERPLPGAIFGVWQTGPLTGWAVTTGGALWLTLDGGAGWREASVGELRDATRTDPALAGWAAGQWVLSAGRP